LKEDISDLFLFIRIENMTDTKQKGINPITAALTGALVGAGVVAAGVGVVAMQDENNRKKVKDAFKDVKVRSMKAVNKLKDGINAKKDEMGNKIADGVSKANDKIHNKVDSAVKATS
jgi:hypothetical protein